jgi:hypothetical protein
MAATTGIALAVSGGGYDPSQQDCRSNADASTTKTATPGCHNFKLSVADSKGKRYAELGLDQMPQGPATPGLAGVGYPGAPNFPHAGCVAVNTNGTGGHTGSNCGTAKGGAGAALIFDTENPGRTKATPSTGPVDTKGIVASAMAGTQIYLGADDNLDAGEHDGVTGMHGTKNSVNGPSDGGAITVGVAPGKATKAPSATNLVPVATASEGACADGFCEEVTTVRQAVFHGGGTANSRDAANYQDKKWDPYTCSSGSPTSESTGTNGCGPQTMDQWRAKEAKNVYAEPGVQIYEDPDPQGSPIDPIYEAGIVPKPILYPLPAAYVGSCGVIVGGGGAPPAPASPLTNKAGQIVIAPKTGC